MGFLDDIKKLIDEKQGLENKIGTKSELINQPDFIKSTYRLFNVNEIIKNMQTAIYDHFDKENNYEELVNFINSKTPDKPPFKMVSIEKDTYQKTIEEIETILNVDERSQIMGKDIEEIKPILESYKKNHPELGIDKIFDECKKTAHKSAFGFYLRNNLKDCLTLLEDKMPSTLINDLDRINKEYVSLEDNTIKVSHPEEKNIEDAKTKSIDEKTKANLDYLNKEVLITKETNDLNEYAQIAEKIGANAERIVNMNGYESTLKSKTMSGILQKNGPNVNSTYTENKSDLIKQYNEMKFELSPDTKEILRRGLKKLASMTGPDGAPMFDPTKIGEEASKIYSFKNISSIYGASKDIVNELNKDSLTKEERALKENELDKLVQKHQDTIKDYDELIGIVKEFKTDGSIPANVSISRNPIMPEKYIKDVENVSLINGMWNTLSFIHDSGLSIDEFVDDPNKAIENFNSKNKNYGTINQYVDKHSELDLIELMNIEKHSENETKTKERAGLKTSYDIMRKLSIFSHIEHDPAKKEQNQLKNTIQVKFISGYAPMDFVEITKNFLNGTEQERVDTIKNILIQDGEHKNYVGCSKTVKDLICPITGEKIEKFDYQSYINNQEIDYNKLTSKLDDYKQKIEANPKQYASSSKLIDKSIKDIATDLLKTKSLTNEESFEKIVDLAGLTMKDYMKNKVKGSLRDYSKQFLARNKTIDEKNLKGSLLCLATLKENYQNRSGFSKIFNPAAWVEKRAINNMDKAITDSGVSREKIDSIINKEKTINEVVNEVYPKQSQTIDKQIDNPSRVKIKVVTEEVKKDVSKKVVENNKEKKLEDTRTISN